MICGIYRIRHKRSGSAYVGASVNVENRYTWHRWALRHGCHTCKKLQVLWDKYGERAFIFELLERHDKKGLRQREDVIAKLESKLLNIKFNVGWRHDEKTKQKMRDSRALYLTDPEAIKSLSKRAKLQHVNGTFGHKTWITGPRYNPLSGEAGRKRLCALAKDPAWSKRRTKKAKAARRFVYNIHTGQNVLMKKYRSEA